MENDMFYVIGAAAAPALLLLFMVCPTLRKHPDRQLLEGRYIAHRGLHGLQPDVPENSLPAFALAAKLGFPVELDIHLSRDGEVIVFHDGNFRRMCGSDKKPENCTLAEIRNLRLAGTRERIPTLAECLAVIDGRVPVLIEFKCSGGSCRPLCRAADQILAAYQGAYQVQSFYPPVLYWYRRHRKEVMRGQLAGGFRQNKHFSLLRTLLSCLVFNFLARPDFISYQYANGNNLFFRLCRQLGASSCSWTFRTPRELKQYKQAYRAWIFEGFVPANTTEKESGNT